MFEPPSPQVSNLLHNFKIQYLDVHPVRPWIVAVTKKGNIIIADYDSNTIIHNVDLHGIFIKKHDGVALQKIAEKEPDFKGTVSNVDLKQMLKSDKLEDIRSVRFFDEDVKLWNTSNNSTEEKSTNSSDSNMFFQASDSVDDNSKNNETLELRDHNPGRSIVVQTDKQIIMIFYDNGYDYISLHASQTDSKSFIAFEFMYTKPWIVIAGNDGILRFWDFATNNVLNTKIKTHIKNITKLSPIMRGNPLTTVPSLIVCNGDGTIASFSIDKEEPEFFHKKTHDGKTINDLVLCPDRRVITTVGDDRTIIVRETEKGSELRRFKIPGRYTLKHICIYEVCHYVPTWFIAAEASKKLFSISFDLSEGTWNDIVDISDSNKVSKPSEKGKIRCIKVHPLTKNIVFVASSNGVFVLHMDPRRWASLAVASGFITAQGPSASAVVDPPSSVEPPAPVVAGMPDFASHSEQTNGKESDNTGIEHDVGQRSIYYIKNSILYQRTVKSTEQFDMYSEEQPVKRLNTAQNMVLRVSSSGRCLSVMWLDTCEYELYSTNSWQVIGSGRQITNFVWSLSELDRFAVTKKERNKLILSIFEVENSTLRQVHTNIEIQKPVKDIFGGFLLGVETSDQCLQFLRWNDFRPVGDVLPSPKFIRWDRGFRHCLMAFDDSFAVFSCRSGQLKLSQYVKEVIDDALWFQGTLFLSTPAELQCVFPFGKYESILLATFAAAHYTGSIQNTDQLLEPIPVPRPKGVLSLVDLIEDSLCVMDPSKRLHTIPLRHPLIKFRMLISAGLMHQALEWLPFLSGPVQERLCEYLCERGFGNEAIEACTSSLSIEVQLRLAMKYCLPDHAMRVLSSIDDFSSVIGDDTEARERSELLIQFASLLQRAVQTPSSHTNIMRCLNRAAELHPSAYRHLIVYLAKHNFTDELNALKEELEKKNLKQEKAFLMLMQDGNTPNNDKLQYLQTALVDDQQ